MPRPFPSPAPIMNNRMLVDVLFHIKPPVWAVFFLGAGLLVHYLIPETRFPGWGHAGLASLLAVASALTALWAIALFFQHNTPVVPGPHVQVLVGEGPFRYSRNPMYLGLIGALLSFAVGYGTWPLWLPPLALFGILRTVFIPYEERLLEEKFGEDYRAYRARVRRWL